MNREMGTRGCWWGWAWAGSERGVICSHLQAGRAQGTNRVEAVKCWGQGGDEVLWGCHRPLALWQHGSPECTHGSLLSPDPGLSTTSREHRDPPRRPTGKAKRLTLSGQERR